MKLSQFLFLSLSSFLSCAFTAVSNPNPLSDGVSPSPVLDADGGNLQADAKYFVLPVSRGGGGLSPANVKQNSICLRDIIQDSSAIQTGYPVVFSPVDTKTGSVLLSTDLNVKFFSPTVCANETVWRVGKYDEQLRQYFILTGGVEGNPGPETIANWFKIEKYGSDYKFIFCPSVCTMCETVCKDVGIYLGAGGTRFLALSDTPFVVKFKRTVPSSASPFLVPHAPPPRVPIPHGPPPPGPVPHWPPTPPAVPVRPPPSAPVPVRPPPPVPVPHGPPPPVPVPHGSPPPVPVPHSPPPPVPVPHFPPPPVPAPHGPPPPVPVPHGPPPPVPVPPGPPPPVPVPPGPPPPEPSSAVATFKSLSYAVVLLPFSLLFCFF